MYRTQTRLLALEPPTDTLAFSMLLEICQAWVRTFPNLKGRRSTIRLTSISWFKFGSGILYLSLRAKPDIRQTESIERRGVAYQPNWINPSTAGETALSDEILVLTGQGFIVTRYSIYNIGSTSMNLTGRLRKPYDKPAVSLNIARRSANAWSYDIIGLGRFKVLGYHLT